VTLVVVEVVVVKQNIMRASFCLYYHSSAAACVVLLLVEVVEVLEAYSGTHALTRCYRLLATIAGIALALDTAIQIFLCSHTYS